LAPFYDHDGNGEYNPYFGDYPIFKENGDATAIAEQLNWTIFNDNGDVHSGSNVQPMLVEVHQTTYALHCPSDTLLKHTVFN